ncbi:hypothetical protein JKF63_03250 [Porcisia hertigi]|uniref:Selenoprotein F/M domain-containing protein n=1 Tax=Porcisia hertigi TaxID=2761500 RepID=A0A836IAB4_9TRYP|nr:hypothetical protein JKF63_03250 [Porcisia hertigi]
MRLTTLALLCLIVALLNGIAPRPSKAAADTASDCSELGFEKNVVRCSACAKLFLLTQSTELRQECEGCCTLDERGSAADDEVTYTSARIEGRGITHLIALSTVDGLALFMRKYKMEPYFKKISIVEKSSSLFPAVVLIGRDPKQTLTMRITGWSAETLHDLFRRKIRVE